MSNSLSKYLLRSMLRGNRKLLREVVAPSKKRSFVLPRKVLPDGLDLSISGDDEYRMIGCYTPNVVITTSADPPQPTIRFAKELSLLVPNGRRLNRGQLSASGLLDMCRSDGVTDLIEVAGSDGRGRPTMMKVTHFPYGPTIYYNLSQVIMRSDLEEKTSHMKTQYPHLIFHNVEGSVVADRVKVIMQALFPVPDKRTNRYVSFSGAGDGGLYVRNYLCTSPGVNLSEKDQDCSSANAALLHKIELEDMGPQFKLTPYKITHGSADPYESTTEFEKRHFIRKAKPIF